MCRKVYVCSLSVVQAIKITADLAYLSCLPSSVAFLPKIAQVPASPIHSSTTHLNGESCGSVLPIKEV